MEAWLQLLDPLGASRFVLPLAAANRVVEWTLTSLLFSPTQLTTLAASPRYLAVGASSGGIYCFDRTSSDHKFLQLLANKVGRDGDDSLTHTPLSCRLYPPIRHLTFLSAHPRTPPSPAPSLQEGIITAMQFAPDDNMLACGTSSVSRPLSQCTPKPALSHTSASAGFSLFLFPSAAELAPSLCGS